MLLHRLIAVAAAILVSSCASGSSPASRFLADDIEVLDLVSAQGGDSGAVVRVSDIPEGEAIFQLLAPEFRSSGRIVNGWARFNDGDKTCGISVNTHSASRSDSYLEGEKTATLVFSCPPA